MELTSEQIMKARMAAIELSEVRLYLTDAQIRAIAAEVQYARPAVNTQATPSDLRRKVFARINAFQDILSWQQGESRNALVCEIRDVVDTLCEADADAMKHHYRSTACLHGLHERCRKQCKFCGVACNCECHADAVLAAPVPDAQAQPIMESAVGRAIVEEVLRNVLEELNAFDDWSEKENEKFLSQVRQRLQPAPAKDAAVEAVKDLLCDPMVAYEGGPVLDYTCSREGFNKTVVAAYKRGAADAGKAAKA